MTLFFLLASFPNHNSLHFFRYSYIFSHLFYYTIFYSICYCSIVSSFLSFLLPIMNLLSSSHIFNNIKYTPFTTRCVLCLQHALQYVQYVTNNLLYSTTRVSSIRSLFNAKINLWTIFSFTCSYFPKFITPFF